MLFRLLIHKELRYIPEVSGVMPWDNAGKEESNADQLSSRRIIIDILVDGGVSSTHRHTSVFFLIKMISQVFTLPTVIKPSFRESHSNH